MNDLAGSSELNDNTGHYTGSLKHIWSPLWFSHKYSQRMVKDGMTDSNSRLFLFFRIFISHWIRSKWTLLTLLYLVQPCWWGVCVAQYCLCSVFASKVFDEWMYKVTSKMFPEFGVLRRNPCDISHLPSPLPPSAPLSLISVWGMREWMSGLSILHSLFIYLRCKLTGPRTDRHFSCAPLHFCFGDNQALYMILTN